MAVRKSRCLCGVILWSVVVMAQAETKVHTLATAKPVEDVSLSELRGMSGIVDITSTAQLEAVLAQNSVANSITGNNVIDNHSFRDASGVFSVIQNTGNNVIIQDATIITVTISPQ